MEKIKKIHLAADIFPPDVGGPATYANKIANLLASRDYKVSLLCYGKPDTKNLHPKVKISYISRHWPLPLRYFFYFLKTIIMATDKKIIFAQGPVSAGQPATMAAKVLRKKIIVKMVGDYAWESAIRQGKTTSMIDAFQYEKASGKINIIRKIQYKTLKYATAVITPSYYLKKIIHSWGVKNSKIKVIYNSFDFKNIKILKKDKIDKNLIISVGRLVEWKGFQVLIEAVLELKQKFPNLKLIICGEGPIYKQLEQLIKDNNAQNYIQIKKFEHGEMLNKIKESRFFVLNTAYEGLSHVILECMALKTPVITTDVGGNPELIQDKHTGLLIKYNQKHELINKMQELLEKPEYATKLANNAYLTVRQKFDNEYLMKKTLKFINKTIKAK